MWWSKQTQCREDYCNLLPINNRREHWELKGNYRYLPFIHSLLPPSPEQQQGNRGCGQFITLFLWHFFMATLCPFSMWDPPTAILPCLILCGFPTGHSSPGTAPHSSVPQGPPSGPHLERYTCYLNSFLVTQQRRKKFFFYCVPIRNCSAPVTFP